MARKRKLDSTPVDTPEAQGDATPGMGGMWGGTAINLLRQRLMTTRLSLHEGILNGTVALTLSPDQIADPAGSDRQDGWEDDPEFTALVDNIKRRGQTQAIRVRPIDPDWQPDAETPLQTGDRFIIQSGRRRLAACRALGRGVVAVLSTVQGDAALADLEERFHENTMRQDLSGFEELLSVGLIAQALGDLSQSEIASRLGCSQNDVSLGRACVEMHDQIVANVDVKNTPKRAYREIIPQLRGQGAKASPKPAKAPTGTVAKAQAGDVKVAVKRAAAGKIAISVTGGAGVDDTWLAQAVAALVQGKAG